MLTPIIRRPPPQHYWFVKYFTIEKLRVCVWEEEAENLRKILIFIFYYDSGSVFRLLEKAEVQIVKKKL